MSTAVKPEGKYLDLLCERLHLDLVGTDELSERLYEAIQSSLTPEEIEMFEDKYLHRITVSRLAYKYNVQQSAIDAKMLEFRTRIKNALTKE